MPNDIRLPKHSFQNTPYNIVKNPLLQPSLYTFNPSPRAQVISHSILSATGYINMSKLYYNIKEIYKLPTPSSRGFNKNQEKKSQTENEKQPHGIQVSQ